MKWVQLDGMGHQLEGRNGPKLILKLIDTCNEIKRGSKSVPEGSIKTIQSSSTDPNRPQGPPTLRDCRTLDSTQLNQAHIRSNPAGKVV